MTEEFQFFLGFSCFAVFGIAVMAFWIWMLVDCIQNEPSEGNDKIVWVLVIVLLGWVGALVYFLARRPNRPPSTF